VEILILTGSGLFGEFCKKYQSFVSGFERFLRTPNVTVQEENVFLKIQQTTFSNCWVCNNK
jgi:hypothetical protein